jgi:hypothetical protein
MSENSHKKNVFVLSVLLLLLCVCLLVIAHQNSKINDLKKFDENSNDAKIKRYKLQNDSLNRENEILQRYIEQKDIELGIITAKIDSISKTRKEREIVFIDRVGKIEKMSKNELEEYFKKELQTIFP